MNDQNSNEDSAWAKRVSQSFGNAAESYDANAPNQRRCAETLIEWMFDRVPQKNVEIGLEIGCGTGFLTRLILQEYPSARWTISDIASSMVEYCRSIIGQSMNGSPPLPINLQDVDFVVANGEQLNHGVEAQNFDLICSNLSFQWFENLETGLRQIVQHLRSDGWLFFSTLSPQNLSLIQTNYPCLQSTLHCGTPSQVIEDILNPFGDCEFISVQTTSSFDDLAQFLKSLKLVGASTSRSHAALPMSHLRAAIDHSKMSDKKIVADYEFLLVAFRKR